MRPFAKWCGKEIEVVCQRNDVPLPGKPLKPPWETTSTNDIFCKIQEESSEAVEAYFDFIDNPTDFNRDHLSDELADLAAVAMMLSARINPIMSGLRRGRVRGREFPE